MAKFLDGVSCVNIYNSIVVKQKISLKISEPHRQCTKTLMTNVILLKLPQDISWHHLTLRSSFYQTLPCVSGVGDDGTEVEEPLLQYTVLGER